MRLTVAWLASWALIAAPVKGSAQVNEDRVSAVAAALRALRAEMRAGRAAVVAPPEATAEDTALAAAVAERLGYSATSDRSTVVTFQVVRVELAGIRASVHVEAFPGGYLAAFSVSLIRSGNDWVVHKATLIEISQRRPARFEHVRRAVRYDVGRSESVGPLQSSYTTLTPPTQPPPPPRCLIRKGIGVRNPYTWVVRRG